MKKEMIKKMALCAIMAALFVVLDLFSITTQFGKITFSAIPLCLVAILYGPGYGLIVAILGSFITQLFGPYGLTVTTPLWMLPFIVRSFYIGMFYKNNSDIKNHIVKLFIIVISSGVIASLLNTFAYYIDSKIFNYYSKELITIEALYRLLITTISSAVIAAILIPIIKGIKKIIK